MMRILLVAAACLPALPAMAQPSIPTMVAPPGQIDAILPPEYKRLTSFGERPSWSPDGKRIAFMEKSFGDAFEIDLETRRIRLLTNYPHAGFLRVQFLPNGDYLLIGARNFTDLDRTRYHEQEFWLMKADLSRLPVPLNQKVSEGVAISRKTTRIAWANDFRTSPDLLPEGECAIFVGDVVTSDGAPRIANKREVVRIKGKGCRMEAQDFRNGDNELVYVVYRDTPTVRLADVMGVDLTTLGQTTYRQVETEYNEAEGIFPDGQHTLVESDRAQTNPRGSKTLDIWKLRLLPNSTDYVRVTRFGDLPGYKATNPVVSPDGLSVAFQEGWTTDIAGVGHGLFLLNLAPAPEPSGSATVLSSSEIDRLVPAGSGSNSVTLPLSVRGQRIVALRRDQSGEVEVHDTVDDLFVVRSGRARVLVGGTVSGNRQVSSGEWRGGTVRGGKSFNLGPGDLLRIPAGQPHQIFPDAGAEFGYLAIKSPKPQP